MDNLTILDKMQKGLAKIAVIFKRRRVYAWAVFNAYLFGEALKRDAVSSPFKYECKNVKKWLTSCERKIIGLDGKCEGEHVLSESKRLVAMALRTKGRQMKMWEAFSFRRLAKKVMNEVEDMVESGDIAKLRVSAQAILYLQVVAKWSDVIDYGKLERMKEMVEKKIEEWNKTNGIKYDALMFRLSRKSRWIRTIDTVQHPKYWLVWVGK